MHLPANFIGNGRLASELSSTLNSSRIDGGRVITEDNLCDIGVGVGATTCSGLIWLHIRFVVATCGDIILYPLHVRICISRVAPLFNNIHVSNIICALRP